MIRNFLFFGGVFVVMLLLGKNLQGYEAYVNTDSGEEFVLEIDPDETFSQLQEKIADLTNGNESGLLVELSNRRFLSKKKCLNAARDQGGYLGYPRNYYVEVTPEEKNWIRFIVLTLANKALITIAIVKNDIEEAGTNIDHLHPLRFLMTIFADEELKAGIRNIRSRGWIWNHFTAGLKESLSTEHTNSNLTPEQVQHFAQILNVKADLYPVIKERKWDEFIDLLITLIPRKGDHDRYDT